MLDGMCREVIAVPKVNRALPDNLNDWRALPWLLRGYASLEMRRALEQIRMQAFDVVLIQNIFMAQYRDIFSVPTILQEYNIESHVLRQYAEHPELATVELYGLTKSRTFWNATWRIFAEYENTIWATFPLRTAVSDADKEEMDRRCSTGRTVVIENGVNLDPQLCAYGETSRKILFMGTMNYPPNADAVSYLTQSILPLLWQKDPSVVACIAGRNMSQAIKDLASDTRMEIYDSPEDMRAVARECCLSIVPLRFGGGTRIKILDAFAMGLPVVSTSLGCAGLTVRDDHHLLVADDPACFADAVVRLLDDATLRMTLRSNARKLIEERYQWQAIFHRLEAEMFSLLKTQEVLS
jgi:glycosyltransferase involved in cell wall biosynthesis